MMMEIEELEKLDWKFCSHVSFSHLYIRTEKAFWNGTHVYRHFTTRKNKNGTPGNSKLTYSENLNGRDLTPQKLVNKMIKMIQENPPQSDK